MSEAHAAIGIDVGGTSIKGAAVAAVSGALLTRRYEVATPEDGRIRSVISEITKLSARVREELGEDPPIGVALPGAISHGRMCTAYHLHDEWVGADARSLLTAALGTPCAILNDADAAAIAEQAFGAAREVNGTVLLIAFGTGIGSALLRDGNLIPNLELGHLELGSHADIEQHVAASVITREGLDLAQWADRATPYLRHLELLFTPDLFIIGGAISAIIQSVLPMPEVATPVVAARFTGDAGIIGAALAAMQTIPPEGAR